MGKKKPKGLGDIVKSVTEGLGIEQCNNCKQRQANLNVKFAFNKPKLMTDDQKILMLTEPLKVYNEVFGMNIEEIYFNGGVQKAIIKKLNILKDEN